MALIIAGHQRSGTTMLWRLCNSHPDVALTHEFGSFLALDEPFAAHARFALSRWWNRRNLSLAPAPSALEKRVKGVSMLHNLIFTLRYLAHIGPLGRDAVDAVAVEGALQRLFPAARIVGDKYPDYAFKLDGLARLPTVRCLFIYRDPRDVASSAVKQARTVWRNWWPAELRQPQHVARRWVHLIELMESHAASVHAIRYEDLAANPRPVVQSLGQWLDVDPGGFRYESIHAASVGKHVHGLSEQEVAAVIDVAGVAMQRLGYQI